MTYLLRILLCTFLIAILMPLLFVVAFVIKIESNGPIIHWSKRVGVKNKTFFMPKFRTMLVNAPQVSTELMSKKISFVTRFGKFLRKLSIDEIPQIYSILRGDMVFIGPRPALFNQYDLVKMRAEKGIDKMTPGITGWAQINGRDNLSNDDKIKYEYEYLMNQSFIFDIKIILLTVVKIFVSKDISH